MNEKPGKNSFLMTCPTDKRAMGTKKTIAPVGGSWGSTAEPQKQPLSSNEKHSHQPPSPKTTFTTIFGCCLGFKAPRRQLFRHFSSCQMPNIPHNIPILLARSLIILMRIFATGTIYRETIWGEEGQVKIEFDRLVSKVTPQQYENFR